MHIADCKFKLNKYIASHKLQPEEAQACWATAASGRLKISKTGSASRLWPS